MDRLTPDTALPAGIICVVRAPTPEQALTIGRGVRAAGVDAIEITFTVPGAVDVIAELRRSPGAAVGAGTVRSVAQAEQALGAGAEFLVSPAIRAEVVAAAHRGGVPAVPGALTPVEVEACLDAGAVHVKIFPIGSVGGAAYIRALSEPLPEVRWVVSGGISVDDVASYRDAGCHAVCLGGTLIDRRAAEAGDVDAVTRHAAQVMAALAP
ncbi:bifunctional 4-hydroxy-2-oxoglutarate aldolase/2-dehydro-3-deoxy-phosphogluconate aldolase [Microbacterium sp. KHB019]|uniref:bifunctional 4-hydroxy-2-oxoglutarate aldolase/2-dehydro-3-deoxy-phosphogluconate aldolase n=1 Tax=Microbacterium sp. KHB019 TaxID=3129770 RepID=UPI003079A456